MGVLDNIFKSGGSSSKTPTSVSREPRYVEVNWAGKEDTSRQYVKVIPLNSFSDVEVVLESLRDRNAILILKVKQNLVQEKLELKRALKRIQRTTAAIGGDIAGVREDIIVVTPPEVAIFRGQEEAEVAPEPAVQELPKDEPELPAE